MKHCLQNQLIHLWIWFGEETDYSQKIKAYIANIRLEKSLLNIGLTSASPLR